MIAQAAIIGLGVAAGRLPMAADPVPALARIGGVSLLGHALDRLAAQGVRRVVLPMHRGQAMIAAALAGRGGGPDLSILDLSAPATEGATLAAAAAALAPGAFFVLRADTPWFDGYLPALSRLARKWSPDRMDALLLVHSTARAIGYEGRGDYLVDPGGAALRRRGRQIATHVFCGVAVLATALVAAVATEQAAVTDLLDAAESEGRLFAVAHDGLWAAAADPDSVAELEVAIGFRPVPAAEAEKFRR